MAQFEIRKSSDGEYYYHLKATGNSEIILRGTQYKTKDACRRDIDSAKLNAPFDIRYSRLIAQNSQYYFNLNDARGNVVGTSEMYTSREKRDYGIELVKIQAPNAPVIDLT